MRRKSFLAVIAALCSMLCICFTLTACGHKHVLTRHDAVKATCTTDGSIRYWECTDCGKYFGDAEGTKKITKDKTVVVATGHTEVTPPAKASTCTETGLTGGKMCDVCGEILEAQQEVAALGHKEEVMPAVAATCTEAGLTEGKKCSVCNEILVAQKENEAALGHKEEVIPAVAATCMTTGLTEGKKCSVCGEILLAQQKVAALEHNYIDKVCEYCGDIQYSQGLSYTLSDDGTGYVVALLGNCTDTVIAIPKEYNGKPVVGIRGGAFYSCDEITSVIIPGSIKTIGRNAFASCYGLVSVTISEGVTTIGEIAFV